MKLVTVAQAKLRLRVDGDDLDSDLDLMIEGASILVLRHLDGAAAEFLDENSNVVPDEDGNPIVPADVQNAALVLVGIMLRDPDGTESKDWDAGYLPRPVTSLLMSRRKPPLA